MNLSEAKANFGRTATYRTGVVTEQGEIRGVWGEMVQFMVGEGHLRMVDPKWLTLEAL